MLVSHFALDLLFSSCMIYFWVNMPTDDERYNETLAPFILIYMLSALIPETILKGALCTRINKYTANQLKSLYFNVCVG